jgi:hypothetical protein
MNGCPDSRHFHETGIALTGCRRPLIDAEHPSPVAYQGEIDMKQYFLAGMALAFLAVGMTASKPAQAARVCNSSNQGATYATVTNSGDTTLYNTYMCSPPNGWQLVSVLECNNISGKCAYR